MIAAVGRTLPGIVALCLGALAVRWFSALVDVNELLLAIGFGVALTNTVGVPDRLRAGIATHDVWLAAGIVLLGSSLTVGSVLETGNTVLLLVGGAVAGTVLIVEGIARNVAGLAERLGSLLAAGAGICGVSAVVAVGGAIRAKEAQIAYAAGVVLLIDTITIVVYPIVGSVLELSGIVFGVWAGVSMLSTGPVVAVGFAHSEVAGQWATMTKLARNALIGAVALGYASYYARQGSGGPTSLRVLWTNFPKFVLGFLAFVGLASVGVFSSGQRASMANAVDWLFLLAFVGLGTEIRIDDLKRTGVVPAFIVFGAVSIVSVLSLAIALAVL